MRDLKIAIYALAKNEAHNVPRFLDTTKDADTVIVTDTGSTDDTVALLQAGGAVVHTANILPWRFDTAFNCALCNVPPDTDICIKLDLDEVIYSANGRHWRDELQELWTPGISSIRYWYTWSWHVPGQIPAMRFRTVNVHARTGFFWRHPGHATPYNCGTGKSADAKHFEIHHYMEKKKRPDYIALLQMAVAENKCPRTIFYLGREHFFRKEYKQCINLMMDYLEHPDTYWKEEKADAMRMIGLSWEQFGQIDTATGWLSRAVAECPKTRDTWWALAAFFHRHKDFLGGWWAVSKCLAITDRNALWCGQTADAWHDLPYAIAADCALQAGQPDAAVRLIEKAIQLNPHGDQTKAIAKMIGVM